jgi:hypothetical protein
MNRRFGGTCRILILSRKIRKARSQLDETPSKFFRRNPQHGVIAEETSIKKTPWFESASELYRPSDRRLSAKRLPTCADRGCHAVSVTDPYGRILGFLDRSRYFSIK